MKCNVKNRAMTDAELKRFQKENIKSGDRYLNFIQRAMMISVRNVCGFGADRMHRLNEGAYHLGRAYLEDYKAEYPQLETQEQIDEMYGVEAYYMLCQRMCDFGFDPEVEIWGDGVFLDMIVPQSSHALRKKALACAEYAERMSFYVREIMCMVSMQLHEENGFGAERLRRVMHPVRDRYLSMMRSYVEMDGKAMKMAMQQVLDEFNMLGVFPKEYSL